MLRDEEAVALAGRWLRPRPNGSKGIRSGSNAATAPELPAKATP